MTDAIQAAVLRHVAEILVDTPVDRIRLTDRLKQDLQMDGDDCSLLLIPGLEREFDVDVPQARWGSVSTVQDVIDLLRDACRAKGLG